MTEADQRPTSGSSFRFVVDRLMESGCAVQTAFGLWKRRVNGRRANPWITSMTWNQLWEPLIASACLFSGWELLWSACCCCCCQLATIITGLEVTVIPLLSPVPQTHCARLSDLQEEHCRCELMKSWKSKKNLVQQTFGFVFCLNGSSAFSFAWWECFHVNFTNVQAERTQRSQSPPEGSLRWGYPPPGSDD